MLTYDDVKDTFIKNLTSDDKAEELFGKWAKNKTYANATKYAAKVGEVLGKTLASCAEEVDVLEWDLEHLLPSILGENHEIVSKVCVETQENINAKAKIGIKAQEPKFNGNRAYGMVEEYKDAKTWGDIEGKLTEQIINFSESVVDDAIYTNASYLSNSGVKAFITRTLIGSKNCEWCEEAAGTYDYWEVKEKGHPVWRRHLGCCCQIDFHVEKGRGYASQRVNNYKKKK